MKPFGRMTRLVAAAIVALGLWGTASAQDFVLPYNKTPETAPEFWAAARYDVSLGNYDRAAGMIGNFYDKVMALGEDDQRKFFLNMYDREGISPLLNLSTIPAIKKVMRPDPAGGKSAPAIDLLVAKMTKYIDARLSDQERIRFFVTQLNQRPEQRAYAIAQLRASGARSIPAMVNVLRDPAQQQLHGAVYSALLKMDTNIDPPLLAALDSNNDFLKTTIVDVFTQRADNHIVPDLYYLSAAKSSSNALKEKAKLWLTKFLGKSEKELADPRAALVAEAERYNQHAADLSGQGGAIWTWNDQTGLTSQPADASRIEEALGIGYARKALDLDPSYRPAQIELLSIALDKLYERGGPSVSVAKAAPQLQELLAGSPVEILQAVLGKALKENHANAALGAAKALAAHGDPSMLKLTEHGAPPLLQALRSPDRRVQFAAAEAVLAVANNIENYPGSSRVVDVLRHAVTSNGPSKALVGLGDQDKANQIAGLLKPLGFEGQAVGSGRRILSQASAEGNIGLVIVDATLPDPGFNYFLSQYKTNPATAGIPLLVIADKDKGRYAEETLAKLPNVKVIANAPLSSDLLKAEVTELVGDKTKPVLTAAERSAMARAAVDYLGRIASGEIKGYDMTAADSTLIKALNDDALAVQASSALAYRPTREAQMALTTVLLNESRPAPIRAAIASALRSHVQRFGNRLTAEQVGGIVKLAQSASNPVLREQADLTAATLHADAATFGNRLKTFIPTSGSSAPAKVEPGKDGN
jgi:hypothetical protein